MSSLLDTNRRNRSKDLDRQAKKSESHRVPKRRHSTSDIENNSHTGTVKKKSWTKASGHGADLTLNGLRTNFKSPALMEPLTKPGWRADPISP